MELDKDIFIEQFNMKSPTDCFQLLRFRLFESFISPVLCSHNQNLRTGIQKATSLNNNFGQYSVLKSSIRQVSRWHRITKRACCVGSCLMFTVFTKMLPKHRSTSRWFAFFVCYFETYTIKFRNPKIRSITKNRHGFKKKRSTVNQMILSVEFYCNFVSNAPSLAAAFHIVRIAFESVFITYFPKNL